MHTLSRAEQKIVHDELEKAFSGRRNRRGMSDLQYRQMDRSEFGLAIVAAIKATKKLSDKMTPADVARMVYDEDHEAIGYGA